MRLGEPLSSRILYFLGEMERILPPSVDNAGIHLLLCQPGLPLCKNSDKSHLGQQISFNSYRNPDEPSLALSIDTSSLGRLVNCFSFLCFKTGSVM